MRVTWSGSKYVWGVFMEWGYKGVRGILKLLIKLKSNLSYNCGGLFWYICIILNLNTTLAQLKGNLMSNIAETCL